MSKCPKCPECRVASHHWMSDPLMAYPDGTEYACKHCDVRGRTCPACGGAGCDGCNREGVVLDPEVTDLRRQNAALQAIVDKLPKDAEGNLTLPGDERYHPDELWRDEPGVVHHYEWAEEGCWEWVHFASADASKDTERKLCECYGTRAAAEAARDKGQGTREQGTGTRQQARETGTRQ